jgi:uncharacterized protein DUF732
LMQRSPVSTVGHVVSAVIAGNTRSTTSRGHARSPVARRLTSRCSRPRWRSLGSALVPGAALAALTILVPVNVPVAHADVIAYLVNVTVRPGYNFANTDDAIGYGRGLCDAVSRGRAYDAVIADVKRDFNTGDEYQASYLITQAVNELCPASIWQLRNSAAGYGPGPE